MSDDTQGAPIVEAQGPRLTEVPGTEAHAARGRFAPAETEAHAVRARRDVAETEAHAMKARGDVPETEAHAALQISFPPDAEEQTLTISYRPPANPGDEPEVEPHGLRWSDRSLKRDIHAI